MKTILKVTGSAIVLLVFVVVVQNYVAYSSTLTTTATEIPQHSPAPMPTSSKTSFEAILSTTKSQGLKIYTPTWIPDDFKPTVAYGKINDGAVQGVLIFLFSAKGAENIDTAELTMEVYSSETLPYDPKTTSVGEFIKINGYDAFIYDKAPVALTEYNKLYGSTARLVSIQIGTTNYLFRGEPSISMEEMIKIVESLS